MASPSKPHEISGDSLPNPSNSVCMCMCVCVCVLSCVFVYVCLIAGRPQTEPEIGNRTGISENRTGYGLQRNWRNPNRRNRNRGLQKVVPLHRPEVGQIKSCRGLSTTIRKRSARSTKWTWFGFPRGLAEARFLFFWFFQRFFGSLPRNQFFSKQKLVFLPRRQARDL